MGNPSGLHATIWTLIQEDLVNTLAMKTNSELYGSTN